MATRGDDKICGSLFSYIDLEDRESGSGGSSVAADSQDRERPGGALGPTSRRSIPAWMGAAVGSAGEAAAGVLLGTLGTLGTATDGADRVRPAVPVVCRAASTTRCGTHSSSRRTATGCWRARSSVKFLTAVPRSRCSVPAFSASFIARLRAELTQRAGNHRLRHGAARIAAYSVRRCRFVNFVRYSLQIFCAAG